MVGVSKWQAGQLPGGTSCKRRKMHRILALPGIAPDALWLGLDPPEKRAGLRGDAVRPRKRGGAAPRGQLPLGQLGACVDDGIILSRQLLLRETDLSYLQRQPRPQGRLQPNVRTVPATGLQAQFSTYPSKKMRKNPQSSRTVEAPSGRLKAIATAASESTRQPGLVHKCSETSSDLFP